MRMVDLTRPIKGGMEVYPGDPEVWLTPVAEMPAQSCRVTRLTFGSHTGTHIDAPSHVLREGSTLDEMPPEGFFGRAQVFPGDTDFNMVDFRGLDFVLLNFNWAGQWGKNRFYQDYPIIDSHTAAILSITGLRGVGMDTPSVDNHESELDNHHILLASGMLVIENLINLDKVGNRPFTLVALPLKWKDADGAPCRAVAVLED